MSDQLKTNAQNQSGVVQWVIPKRKTRTKNKENIKSKTPSSPMRGYESDERSNPRSFVNQNYNRSTSNSRANVYDGSKTNSSASDPSPVDHTTCRTISLIVEQYIKELREHQRHINAARARLIREMPRSPDDGNFIGYNDLSKLRVRDEQTKAIETIKQLTNYLRELSILKNQLDSAATTNSVSENIHNKLSDVRNDIVQALNDFVLANSDIDIPIIDPDDLNGREYDLCIDARRSNGLNGRKFELSQTITSQGSTSSASRPSYPPTPMSDQTNVQEGSLVLSMSSNPALEADSLERRKREIQKLESDTVELRKLFADFYNLVKIQGEQIDSIEDNLVIAAQHISEARNHLTHRPMRGLTVLVPVTGCITGALIGGPIGLFIGGKLGGVTIVCASSLLGLLSSLGAQKCITSNVKVKHD